MVRLRKKLFKPLFFIILVSFLLSKPSFSVPLKTQITDLFRPSFVLASSVKNKTNSTFSFWKALKENSKLKKQIDALKQKNVKLEEASRENLRLKKLLSFKNKTPFLTVAARVIGRDPSNWASAIIIDKGKKDKIQCNMPVITELGLVGKISEVGARTSKVILINDPNLSIPALIQRSREEGIISGTILEACKMRYLALGSDLEIADKVITSGLSSIFPKGIMIGEIAQIKNDPSGLMKLCLIDPSVSLSRVEEVLVIIK